MFFNILNFLSNLILPAIINVTMNHNSNKFFFFFRFIPDANQVGREPCAKNANPIRDVSMAHVRHPGNVSAKRAGVVCFVIKI